MDNVEQEMNMNMTIGDDRGARLTWCTSTRRIKYRYETVVIGWKRK